MVWELEKRRVMGMVRSAGPRGGGGGGVVTSSLLRHVDAHVDMTTVQDFDTVVRIGWESRCSLLTLD